MFGLKSIPSTRDFLFFLNSDKESFSLCLKATEKAAVRRGRERVRKKKKKLFGNLCWLLVNLAGREAALVTLLE